MRVLKGVIHSADKNEVVVSLDNGMKVKHANDGGFGFADRVIVWFDWHNLQIVRLTTPQQLQDMLVEKAEEPEHDPEETTVEVEESGSEGSLPLRVGEGDSDSDFGDSESESDVSFQLFECEFGEFPDELD